ncbi:MAG TPA: hypothetical protein VF139_17245 [Candidatus Polarisedimenticolaceae bacterium]
MRRWAPTTALLLLGFAARAETFEYAIEVRADEPAAFEIPFESVFAGSVAVTADWKGPRILSLRLEGPGEGAIWRRSGPSPQRIDVDVDGERLAAGRQWKITLRALAARGEARGTVRIDVPDAPEVVAARERAAAPPPPPPPIPDPWAVAARPPEGAEPRLVALYRNVEGLRAAIYGDDPFHVLDACDWQNDLARWLTARRDALAGGGSPPAPETLRFLKDLAAAIDDVESLRTTRDPILGGPAPEDPLRRRAWLAARREALAPYERDLDRLAEATRGNFLPELEPESWPGRLVACLTGCQRHFEARSREGNDAAGGEQTDAQWPRILRSGEALRSLARWLPPPAP